jgi:uncharacterized membrane protein YsdA (DUF1294 family)
VLILLVVFGVIGYIMFLYDKLQKNENGKWRLNFSQLKLV